MNLNNELNQTKNTSFTKVNNLTLIMSCIYFFLSFYENYLNQSVGSITKYLLILIIILLGQNNKKFIFKWYHISIFLWFVLKFTSILWSRDDTIMKQHIISQIGMVVFFSVMTTARYDKKFIDSILGTILYTSASMGVLAIFFSAPYHGSVESRQVLTLFGIETDPNNMAALYMVGVSIALYNIVYKKKKIVLNGLIFGINTFGVGLTGSRGGLITFLAVMFCFVILTDKSKNKIRSLVLKILFSFGLLVIVYLILQLLLPASSFERILGFDNYEGGSNRDFIWKNVWSLFSASPLFGAGWGSYYGYNGYFTAVHNTYLAMLSDVGIIGFSLFFAPVIWVVKESLRKKIPLSIIILVTGLVPSIFLDAINKRFFWNAIILAFVIINGQTREKEVL